MSIDKELLDRLMEGRWAGDLFGKTVILAELSKAMAERALTTEMDIHLEESAEHEPEGQNQPANRCDGSSQKTVTADSGKVALQIPATGPALMFLTAGQQSDYIGARALLNGLPPAEHILADRGDDADRYREVVEDKSITKCIPSRKNRKDQVCHGVARFPQAAHDRKQLRPAH